jgi:hypothetical protein
MNSKTTIVFSIAAIAAVALLFASGPIISSQQTLAFVVVHGHAGFYHGHGFYHGYGFYHHPYYGHGFDHGYGFYHHPYYGHGFYHGHGFVHVGRTVMTPHGIYHRGVTVGGY